jgi:hypothetical protein
MTCTDLLPATVETLGWMSAGLLLETEVDRRKVRPKADPGYCFICAGWLPLVSVAKNPRASRRFRALLTLRPGPDYA